MALPQSLGNEDDKLQVDEAEARFKRVIGNLVNTPHKPHAPGAKLSARKNAKSTDR